MNIKFDQELKNYKGESIMVPQAPLGVPGPVSFREVSCEAVMGQPKDTQRGFKEIHQRQKLAEKIWASDETTDFTETEVTMICTGFKDLFTTVIAAPALKILQVSEHKQA